MFKIQGMFAFSWPMRSLFMGGTFLVTGFLTGLSTFIFGVKPLFVGRVTVKNEFMDIWSIWKTHLITYQVQSRKYAEHVHTKVTLRFPGHTCIAIVHLLRPTADASSRGEAAAKPRPPPRGRCELGEGLGKSRILWIADMGWHCRRFVSKSCYTVYIYIYTIIHI